MRIQRIEERYESCRLCGAQIISVSRHVAAPLNHLTDELVLGEAHMNLIERRAAFSPGIAERMAVATLLLLKDKGTVTLQSRAAFQVLRWDRQIAPCIHDRTPGWMYCSVSQGAQCHGDQKDGKDSDWPALPALLTLAGKEWERKKHSDSDYWVQ